MRKEIQNLLIKAVVVAFVGGISAMVLTQLMTTVNALQYGAVISSLLLFVLLVYLRKSAKIDDVKWFDAFLLLFVVGIVGGLLTAIAPQLSPFILAWGSEITLSGLMWTVLYVMISEITISKVGLKV